MRTAREAAGVHVDPPRPRPEGPRAAQAAADSPAPLLQLPHVDMEAVKRLGRKRVRALADLAALAPGERVAQLTAAGAPPRRGRKPDAHRARPHGRLARGARAGQARPRARARAGDRTGRRGRPARQA